MRAARRAAVGARPALARRDAGIAPGDAGPARRHLHLCNARPRGGAARGPPDRRAQPRPAVQLLRRADLYRRPATPFVASFVGPISWLRGELVGGSSMRLSTGEEVPVARSGRA